jgi:hypothetical protein
MVALADRKIAFPRRPEELPDPALPPHAEVNKKQKLFSVRVDPELKEEFEKIALEDGVTKREYLEDALRLFFEARRKNRCVPQASR